MPPAERECLDHENIGLNRIECGKETVATQGLERFANGTILGIDEFRERGVARPDLRQLDDLDAGLGKTRDRRAAAHHRDIDLGRAQRRGDPAYPRQMTYAEQVLDIDERLHDECPEAGSARAEANNRVSSAMLAL